MARKGGLEGKTDADFALSEMLQCEVEDMYMALVKVFYGDKKFDEFFSAEGEAHRHFKNVEKLSKGSGKFTSTTTVGELAIVGLVLLYESVEKVDNLINPYPNIKALFQKHEKMAREALEGKGHYFKRE